MTRCETIAMLLPDVADAAADPAESAVVGGHLRHCTHCRIQLARERRLSQAIREMRELDVDELFTDAVLERIPSPLPERRRDRRGLKLAIGGGLVALGLGLGAPRGVWGTALPAPAVPSMPADIADPGALAAVAQTVLMALQAFFEAPVVAGALSLVSLPLLLLGALMVLAGMAVSSTLLVVLAGTYARR